MRIVTPEEEKVHSSLLRQRTDHQGRPGQGQGQVRGQGQEEGRRHGRPDKIEQEYYQAGLGYGNFYSTPANYGLTRFV